MDYNRDKREVIRLIDAFAISGKYTTDDISFAILREKGFSERFTVKYIENCLDRNIFAKDKDGIITMKVK